MAVSSAAGVCTTDAVRRSVSRTGGGTTDSVVTSTTKGLRIAYPNVECNISDIGPPN
jgi:hypothetical protein